MNRTFYQILLMNSEFEEAEEVGKLMTHKSASFFICSFLISQAVEPEIRNRLVVSQKIAMLIR